MSSRMAACCWSPQPAAPYFRRPPAPPHIMSTSTRTTLLPLGREMENSTNWRLGQRRLDSEPEFSSCDDGSVVFDMALSSCNK